ncbi:hypothetical protein AC1031_022095 [Aphanomyces cochlioides]|nr:hypothetical protein AC1031_022095 [Aphanomyces cochlioides]
MLLVCRANTNVDEADAAIIVYLSVDRWWIRVVMACTDRSRASPLLLMVHVETSQASTLFLAAGRVNTAGLLSPIILRSRRISSVVRPSTLSTEMKCTLD